MEVLELTTVEGHKIICCTKNGLLHGSPAVSCEALNLYAWYKKGLLHRSHSEDKPAYIHGSELRWYKHGVPHRSSDGPAIITSDYMMWCKNGKTYREVGPSRIYMSGMQMNINFNEMWKYQDHIPTFCDEILYHNESYGVGTNYNCCGFSIPYEIMWKIFIYDLNTWICVVQKLGILTLCGDLQAYARNAFITTVISPHSVCRYLAGMLHSYNNLPAVETRVSQHWYRHGRMCRSDMFSHEPSSIIQEKNMCYEWNNSGHDIKLQPSMMSWPSRDDNKPLKCSDSGYQSWGDRTDGGPTYMDTYDGCTFVNWYYYDNLHRNHGPAQIIHGKYIAYGWYHHGLLHRFGGPAEIVIKGSITTCKYYVLGLEINLDANTTI
jgi:hypothetical protein